VTSGFASGEATSLKLGDDNTCAALEAFPVSVCSSGFASASFMSPESVSRASFHEFVALVLVTETERIRSILKKSLFNHDSGFDSTFESASESSQTFGGLDSVIT